MIELGLYAVTGAIAGLIGGLLGLGGGLIIVPALVTVFGRIGINPAVAVHLAIGTSLSTIIVTAISSSQAHHRRGAVDWHVFRGLTPGIVIGALLGAEGAHALPSHALRIIFGVFELLVAAQTAFQFNASPHRTLPKTRALNVAGGIIGMISSVIGIGGGTLTVPFLVWCNVSIRRAVATSSACGVPIAITGAVGYVLTGWHEPNLPSGATGYLYWPAFAGIALVSLLFAPLGARLAHTLPTQILRRAFSVFLAILGVRMLVG